MGSNKRKIILVCETCLSRNYSLTKSMMTQKDRLEIKKFCKMCNLHTVHKETR